MSNRYITNALLALSLLATSLQAAPRFLKRSRSSAPRTQSRTQSARKGVSSFFAAPKAPTTAQRIQQASKTGKAEAPIAMPVMAQETIPQREGFFRRRVGAPVGAWQQQRSQAKEIKKAAKADIKAARGTVGGAAQAIRQAQAPRSTPSRWQRLKSGAGRQFGQTITAVEKRIPGTVAYKTQGTHGYTGVKQLFKEPKPTTWQRVKTGATKLSQDASRQFGRTITAVEKRIPGTMAYRGSKENKRVQNIKGADIQRTGGRMLTPAESRAAVIRDQRADPATTIKASDRYNNPPPKRVQMKPLPEEIIVAVPTPPQPAQAQSAQAMGRAVRMQQASYPTAQAVQVTPGKAQVVSRAEKMQQVSFPTGRAVQVTAPRTTGQQQNRGPLPTPPRPGLKHSIWTGIE